MKLKSKINNYEIEYLEKLNDKQKKIYKITNILCKETVIVVILLIIFASIIVVSDLTSEGDWSGFLAVIIIYGLMFLFIPVLLFWLGLKNCKKYLFNNNKKVLNKVKILDMFSLVINILYVSALIYDNFGVESFSSILIVCYILLLIIPNIIHLLLCFNLKIKK